MAAIEPVRVAGISIGFRSVRFGPLLSVKFPIAGIDLRQTDANGIDICVWMTGNYVAESALSWRVSR
ncbi:hypothetical protein [Natrialba aegyptia]|uniref:Uncharacterized protein n=1 Tax=Natrialba aegyptia DSM 13077 TaxID=1227491 RepID=M0B4G7_9EURY|nr:hypothetical protein [Natrialba aegyptia]ELZ04519.1 hypothetical protein C480_13431 [Natrialba aegyptia DSM 13077]